MSFIKESLLQIQRLIPTFAIVYIALAGLLTAVVIAGAILDIPIANFTRDPAAILNAHPLVGVISNIGILFWCSTAAICFFASVILYSKKQKSDAIFLFFSGLLTLLLLFDDLFMFHEEFLPNYLHIPERAVYVIYLILILGYFLKFMSDILQSEYTILLIACGFLGLSVISDMVFPQEGLEFLVEDGFKLFGIVTWFLFFSRTSYIYIHKLFSSYSSE